MIPVAIKGGLRPSAELTWTTADGEALDLTGATLIGEISAGDGTSRAIEGSLTVTGATSGEFRWDYAAEDVAEAGKWIVQFTASFASGQTPAKTAQQTWTVKK